MKSQEKSTIDFNVVGMTCGSCAARVQRALERIDGVDHADVNFATHQVRVTITYATASPTPPRHRPRTW